MTKLKTTSLEGSVLDWAVAHCKKKDNDIEIHAGNVLYGRVTSGFVHFRPSTNWSQGGPIIEHEKLMLWYETRYKKHGWRAKHENSAVVFYGSTPLIAAMRCYVASKLGDEIEIPEKLN